MLQLVRRCRSEALRREISSSAVTPRQPRLRSALVVLVVAAPPDARLVAPLGGAVEPLEHAPEAVHSARIGGIGVVDDAVLERERAHARPLARVRGHVGSGHGREGDRPLGGGFRPRVQRVAAALVVVFYGPIALLLLGEPDVEVEIEVAAERGRPRKRPPHPPLVRLQLIERSARNRCHRHVMVRQVDDEAVEPVRDRRAGRTPRFVVGPEHEVVDEGLRAHFEEVFKRGAPLLGLKSIFLVDADPRQFLSPPRQLVAAPRQLLLLLEQPEPGLQPLIARSDLMLHSQPPVLETVLEIVLEIVLGIVLWMLVEDGRSTTALAPHERSGRRSSPLRQSSAISPIMGTTFFHPSLIPLKALSFFGSTKPEWTTRSRVPSSTLASVKVTTVSSREPYPTFPSCPPFQA